MSDLSVAGLDDEPGKVYVFGLSQDAPDSMKDWFLDKDTVQQIQDQFDHARVVVLPMKVDGELAIEEDDADQFVRNVEITVSDEFTD